MKLSFIFVFILSSAGLVSAQTNAPEVHVYFGNLHSHTAYSDGQGTPEEAFTFARDQAKLDFLAVTDHNHLLGGEKASPEIRDELYSGTSPVSLVSAAIRFTENGKFVAIAGQEYSTMSQGNHVNVFDIASVITVPNGKFDELITWMTEHPDSTGQTPVLQLNHPALGGPPGRTTIGKKEFGRDDFGDDAGWVKAMGKVSSLIEILNGEPVAGQLDRRAPQIMEDFFKIYLQLGFHVAPTGDQDNHHKEWGTITDVRTGVIAPALTKKDILEAMRSRHVYATEDKNLKVLIRVDGHLCGDILPVSSEDRIIEGTLEDADEPDAEYKIEALRGAIGGPIAEVVQTVSVKGSPASFAIKGIKLDQPGSFVYFRITQTSSTGVDRAWIAPVWAE